MTVTAMLDASALGPSWHAAIGHELDMPYIEALEQFLTAEPNRGFLPPEDLVFSAFQRTPLEATRVVILGQDPYHGPGQAHGLCFSVTQGQKPPPSLRNIFKELVDDVGCEPPSSTDLTPWAEQGVLLLNTVLTVAPGLAGSHAGQGWEQFTDAAVEAVARECDGVVFLLWGAHAQGKTRMIDEAAAAAGRSHHLIHSPHPSPLSAYRGFFGSRPFSTTNELLGRARREPIDWRL